MTGSSLQDTVEITNRLLIRPMRAEDLAQVRAIDQQSFSLPWPERAFHYELFENPGSLPWVAELAAEKSEESPSQEELLSPPCVVGMIVVWIILDEAHIATIATHPDYRGMGIASRLLARVLQEAIRKGAAMATLEVRASNLAAQQLYQRFRFEVVGRRPRYYKNNNEDAVIMTVDGLGWSYNEWLEGSAWQKPNRGEHDETR